MALAKLTITPQPPSKIQFIEVLFNPNTYSISKSVSWSAMQNSETQRDLNAPRRQFGGGGSRTLTMELFFDVTESQKTSDVREETDRIAQLTRIEKGVGEPPICMISWGGKPLEGSNSPFKGYVSNLVQNFLLFDQNGTPVRAKLNVTFTEFLKPEEDKRLTDPEVTTHVIKRGDTLSSIAAEFYSDPTLWRIIAEANHLDDPRHVELEIGKPLNIPKLR